MCEAPGGFPSGGTDSPAYLSPSGGSPSTLGHKRAALSSVSAHGASPSASALCNGIKSHDYVLPWKAHTCTMLVHNVLNGSHPSP